MFSQSCTKVRTITYVFRFQFPEIDSKTESEAKKLCVMNIQLFVVYIYLFLCYTGYASSNF